VNDLLQISAINESSTEKISTYISTNTIWLVNNQPTSFEFSTIKKDKDFYFLESVPIHFSAPFSTLDLHNSPTLIKKLCQYFPIEYFSYFF